MSEIIKETLALVEAELIRATAKFGPIASAHEGYAVLLEEIDEFWELVKANKANSPEGRAELVQIAAMAVRNIIDMGGK